MVEEWRHRAQTSDAKDERDDRGGGASRIPGRWLGHRGEAQQGGTGARVGGGIYGALSCVPNTDVEGGTESMARTRVATATHAAKRA